MGSGLRSEVKNIAQPELSDLRSFEHPRNYRHAAETPRSAAAKRLAEVLRSAGIHVNGDRPWDIQVHDNRFYQRVLADGTLGAGESYMDGWWDAQALDEFIARSHSVDP